MNQKKSSYVKESDSRVLALGSSSYDVLEGSDFACIMNMFGRKYLVGPCGSAVIMNIILFDLVKIPNTPLHKSLLLAWIVADYIPHFLTLTEILMTFTYDMPAPMGPKYTLEQDPVEYTVEYTLNLLQRYANIHFNEQIPVKSMYAYLNESNSD